MRWNRMFALAIPAALAALLPGQPAAGVQKPGWYEKAVKKIDAKFVPAEAKPGQTVAFQLTVSLNEGYHTYPTVQPDKAAENFVNELKFPKPATVVFVGKTADPKDFIAKAEPILMIKELRELAGTVTYTRKAVVSPKAKPGAAEIKLDLFQLMVCDDSNCFPPKKVAVSAKLKVLDGPAVPVEKEYAEEVARAAK